MRVRDRDRESVLKWKPGQRLLCDRGQTRARPTFLRGGKLNKDYSNSPMTSPAELTLGTCCTAAPPPPPLHRKLAILTPQTSLKGAIGWSQSNSGIRFTIPRHREWAPFSILAISQNGQHWKMAPLVHWPNQDRTRISAQIWILFRFRFIFIFIAGAGKPPLWTRPETSCGLHSSSQWQPARKNAIS